MVLLCGSDKKSQDKEIKQALRYWDDYKSRTRKLKALKAAVMYGLYNVLQDQDFVIEYLNAAMEESNADLFLIALRDVVKAKQGGIARVAEDAQLSRQNLYAMLSQKGNLRLQNLVSVLQTLGLGLQIRQSNDI